MRFLKEKKGIIISFIVGVILAGGIVYAATSAKEVTYTTNKNASIKNVEEALNDLYNKSANSMSFEYLYSGEENLDTLFSHTATNSSQWNYFTKTSNGNIGMAICDSDNVMAAYTNDLIDFTNCKYILVEYELYNNHDSLINTSYFGITDAKDINTNNFIKYGTVIQIGQSRRSGIACIDVNEIQGQHYFKICVHHSSNVSAYGSYTNIKSIKFIK